MLQHATDIVRFDVETTKYWNAQCESMLHLAEENNCHHVSASEGFAVRFGPAMFCCHKWS
jgi:hypothetical protein